MLWKVLVLVCLNVVIRDVILFFLKEKIKVWSELKIKYNIWIIIYEGLFMLKKVYFVYKSNILVIIFYFIC